MSGHKRKFRRVVAVMVALVAIFIYWPFPETIISELLVGLTIIIAVILFFARWESVMTKVVITFICIINGLLVALAHSSGWARPEGQWRYYMIPLGALILLQIGQSIYQRIPPRIRQISMHGRLGAVRYIVYDRKEPHCPVCGCVTITMEMPSGRPVFRCDVCRPRRFYEEAN